MTYQDELFEKLQKAYPECEVKKINKDSNIDIYVPGLHERRNIHINFDVKKDGVNVKLHFVLSDLPDYRFFLEELSDQVSAYGKEGSGSQGIVHNSKNIAFDEYDEIISSAIFLMDLFKNNLDSYLSKDVHSGKTYQEKLEKEQEELFENSVTEGMLEIFQRTTWRENSSDLRAAQLKTYVEWANTTTMSPEVKDEVKRSLDANHAEAIEEEKAVRDGLVAIVEGKTYDEWAKTTDASPEVKDEVLKRIEAESGDTTISDIPDFPVYPKLTAEQVNIISKRIQSQLILPHLGFVFDDLREHYGDYLDRHVPFYYHDNLLVGEEMEGFVFVNMDGFYGNIQDKDEVIPFFSWDSVGDVKIKVDEESNTAKLGLFPKEGEGLLSIEEKDGTSLKIVHQLYRSVYKQIIEKFEDEPMIDWDVVKDKLGINMINYSSWNDFLLIAMPKTETKETLNIERNKLILKSKEAFEVIGDRLLSVIREKNGYIFLDDLTLTIADKLDASRMSGYFGDIDDEDEIDKIIDEFDNTLPLLKPHIKPFDLVFFYYSENALNRFGAYSIRRWKYDGKTMECTDSEIYDLFKHSLSRDDILGYLKSMEFDIESNPSDEELLEILLKNYTDEYEVDANNFVDKNYGYISDMILDCLSKSHSEYLKENVSVNQLGEANGKRDGQGTETFSDEGKYVGEYKGGKKNGQGTTTFSDGSEYVGEYKDGEEHGQGTYTWSDGDKFVGEYKDGEEHGQGTFTSPDGFKFVGEYKGGKKNGQGTTTFSSGSVHVGEWKDGEYNGHGTYTFSDGSEYVGEYKDGEQHGQGTYTWSSGNKYVGEWKDGEQHGQGTRTFSDGSEFVGEWKDGKQQDQGTITFSDGGKYVGELKDNKPWNGTVYDKDGNFIVKIVNGMQE
jgi:hypothetical protein